MLSTRSQYLRGSIRRYPVATEGVGSYLRGDPTSVYFKPPSGDNPNFLVQYLISLQMRRYGETILPYFKNNPAILMRHVKLLLEKYTPEQIKRGICYASWASDYPYSFSFVESCIERYYGKSEKPNINAGTTQTLWT